MTQEPHDEHDADEHHGHDEYDEYDEHDEHDEVAGAPETTDLVLGPDEIINYPLRKATRGYQVREVDDLLDQLAVQTRDLLTRLEELESERDHLRGQVAEAGEAESTLKRTLVTAQRAAEASVAEAHEEADQLRRAARKRAEELLNQAVEQAHELREAALRRARADAADVRRYRRDVEEHIEALRTFAADHRTRLAHHLTLQQDRLAEMELPDLPPEPAPVEDEVLGTEVEHVDVEGLLAELDGDASEDQQDDEPEPDDEQDDAASTDDGVVDTRARLFEG